MIRTTIGNLEVIDNKIVHVTQDSDLSITVENLTVQIVFISDKTETDKIKREVVDETTLKIVCNNFDNSLGEGILAPLEIGHLGGRKLYISFFVWTPNLSQGRRIVNYCLYLE